MFAPMDREWLAAELDGGRSIEAIAGEVGRDPSTVAYCPREASARRMTRRMRRRQPVPVRRDGSTAPKVVRDCPRHG
jgi:hypothetical protein